MKKLTYLSSLLIGLTLGNIQYYGFSIITILLLFAIIILTAIILRSEYNKYKKSIKMK